MTLYGCDYSFSGPMTAAQAKANGLSFIVRYVSDGSSRNIQKTIRQSEVNDFKANGIAIVIVFEGAPGDALGGFAQGATNARLAEAQLNNLGLTGCPVYFAVDFDGVSSQLSLVGSYLDGAASVVGLARTGAYGSERVIRYLFDTGKIHYGWQTYAWSGSALDGRAHLYQYKNEVIVSGVATDLDRTVSSDIDFGQFNATLPKPPFSVISWILQRS